MRNRPQATKAMPPGGTVVAGLGITVLWLILQKASGAAVMCNAIHWDVRAMTQRLLESGQGQLEPIVYRP